MYDAKEFRLGSMPQAQAHVRIIRNDSVLEEVQLISYSTLVIVITRDTDDKFVWSCSGTYSKTTARHIGRFTSEFLGENLYYKAKDIAGTGECLSLDDYNQKALFKTVSNYLHGYASKRFYGNY